MATSSSYTCETAIKRPRLDSETDSKESVSDSQNSSGSSAENAGSTITALPHDISKWQEKNIQSLSIITEYEEDITPFQLLRKLRPNRIEFMEKRSSELICAVVRYFQDISDFHKLVNSDFKSLTVKIMREFDAMFNTTGFLHTLKMQGDALNRVPPVNEEVREWFSR